MGWTDWKDSHFRKPYTKQRDMKVQPKQGDKIVVWFSCGAASAVAAKKTLELYGSICDVVIVNNPIKEEDQDNQRFLRDCEKWFGAPIQSAINSKYPECSIVEVFEDQNFMANVGGLAYCTLELKQRARFQWELGNRPDWTVLGFTKEEQGRFDRFKLKRVTSLHILENTTKSECFQIIQNAGIELPLAYRLGMPNANCKGCIKATSPTYWNLVRKIYPTDFKERAEQSRKIGAKLVRVKGKRIFLDELDPNAAGRPLKDLNFECGIFCNTK